VELGHKNEKVKQALKMMFLRPLAENSVFRFSRETEALVHFGKDVTQQRLMVRLEEPPA
jgi:hypothetical protein